LSGYQPGLYPLNECAASRATYPATWSIDGLIDGRAAGTVTYTLTPEANGTRFVREFTYRAPSLWFALSNWILLKGTIQSESDEA
jgi:hypothetical protein